MHRGQTLGIDRIYDLGHAWCMAVILFPGCESSRLDMTWYIRDTSIIFSWSIRFVCIYIWIMLLLHWSFSWYSSAGISVIFFKAKINGGLLGAWNIEMPDQAPESQSLSYYIQEWKMHYWTWDEDGIGQLVTSVLLYFSFILCITLLDGSLEICWRLFLGMGWGWGWQRQIEATAWQLSEMDTRNPKRNNRYDNMIWFVWCKLIYIVSSYLLQLYLQFLCLLHLAFQAVGVHDKITAVNGARGTPDEIMGSIRDSKDTAAWQEISSVKKLVTTTPVCWLSSSQLWLGKNSVNM